MTIPAVPALQGRYNKTPRTFLANAAMVLSSSVACQPCKPAVFIDEENEVAPTPFFVGELEFEPSNPAMEPEHRTSILSSSD